MRDLHNKLEQICFEILEGFGLVWGFEILYDCKSLSRMSNLDNHKLCRCHYSSPNHHKWFLRDILYQITLLGGIGLFYIQLIVNNTFFWIFYYIVWIQFIPACTVDIWTHWNKSLNVQIHAINIILSVIFLFNIGLTETY